MRLTDEQRDTALRYLNDHQRSRYERRPTAAQKDAYLAGRYYLFELLSAYCGTRASELTLAYSRLNKPYLRPNPFNITFNFTDSNSPTESIGIYAFTRTVNIGVDIESRHRRGNFTSIARRKFSAQEQLHVTDSQGNVDAERFLALWTRKEAYGKATGVGVNYKMNTLDLLSPGQHTFSFKGLSNDDHYYLHQFMVGEDHIGCTAYASPEPSRGPLKISAFRG